MAIGERPTLPNIPDKQLQRLIVESEGSYSSISEWEQEPETKVVEPCTMKALVWGPPKKEPITSVTLPEGREDPFSVEYTIDEILKSYLKGK